LELEPPVISAKMIAPAIGAYTGGSMRLRRRIALAGLGIGVAAMWAGSATAQQAQAPAQAQPNSGRGYTYQNSAPDTGSSGPTVGFQIGKWGSQPSDYPYAQSWSQHARPDDNACNMPSSPCWNEDRE
jgi:hypothetical protein